MGWADYMSRRGALPDGQVPSLLPWEKGGETALPKCVHSHVARSTVVYWQRAGEQASERSATLEAIRHFTTGIELLTTLPETPAHTRQAVTLHIGLGAALQIAKGMAAPEVERAYTQARALCQQVGETPQLVPILFKL